MLSKEASAKLVGLMNYLVYGERNEEHASGGVVGRDGSPRNLQPN